MATGLVLGGAAAWAFVASSDEAAACGSDRDPYALLPGEWVAQDGDVTANYPQAQEPDVAWYAEYYRDVPPLPGALAATELLVVTGRRTGLDESVSAGLYGQIEFTDTEVGGSRAKAATTGGRGSSNLLHLEVRDDFTIQLLSSEAEPDARIEAAGQLDSVCHDEWVEAMQFEPEGERP